jgi:1D-myo-inositol 3-kinase
VGALDFLAIGHLCCDLVNGRRILGGSASYASLTARALGQNVGVATATAEDFPFLDALQGISIDNIRSSSSTTFRNIYTNGSREQFISTVAAPIRARDISENCSGAEIVYLCPIANEVMPEVVTRFPCSLIGAGAQGWFREWDECGRVRKKSWVHAAPMIPPADVISFSELDVDEPYAVAEDLARSTPIVIVTQSSRGADVFVDRKRIHVPAYRVTEVDPTGAGDVFSAAFLIKYHASGDPIESAKFACCAASFICEEEGTKGIPTLDQVLARMKAHEVQAENSGAHR